jgi:hypothetical protein
MVLVWHFLFRVAFLNQTCYVKRRPGIMQKCILDYALVTHQWFFTALSVRPGNSFAIATEIVEGRSMHSRIEDRVIML